MHISHYLQHPNHGYAKYPGHGYYGGAGGYPFRGHPGYYGPRTAYSKSPVRRGNKYMHPAYYDPRFSGAYYDLDKSNLDNTKDPTIMEISQDLNVSQQKALLDAPLTDRMLMDQRASIKPMTAMKKKKQSKVPKDPWNNKFTNNSD